MKIFVPPTHPSLKGAEWHQLFLATLLQETSCGNHLREIFQELCTSCGKLSVSGVTRHLQLGSLRIQVCTPRSPRIKRRSALQQCLSVHVSCSCCSSCHAVCRENIPNKKEGRESAVGFRTCFVGLLGSLFRVADSLGSLQTCRAKMRAKVSRKESNTPRRNHF